MAESIHAALENELAIYERDGKTDRAKAVKAELARLGKSDAPAELADDPPGPERTATRSAPKKR